MKLNLSEHDQNPYLIQKTNLRLSHTQHRIYGSFSVIVQEMDLTLNFLEKWKNK